MTLREMKWELVAPGTAETYIQASREPDEQLVLNLILDEGKRVAYILAQVSLIDGSDPDRQFYIKANYAEAENILNRLHRNG